MAKPKRQSYLPLPLSEAFFGCLARTGRAMGLGPSAGGALSDAVAELSRAYTRDRSELAERSRGQTVLGARLAFFMPRDLVKVFGPLEELRGVLSRPAVEAGGSAREQDDEQNSEPSLRVLDVGAGLGATSLGLARFLRLHATGIERLHVTALERDARALAVFEYLVARELPQLADEFVPITLEARAEDVSDARLGRDFDLVLFGFVLNELYTEESLEQRVEKRAQLLRDAASRLRPGGALIVLEPALKESTRELMQVRDLLAAQQGAPHVFAPCTRTGPCPMLAGERDWCHQELAYALPPKLALVAQGAGLRFEGLSYSSLVLRNEPRQFGSDPNDLFRVVSERLESKGKLELYGCGDAGYVRFTRLDRDHSERNRAFGEAQRGHLLRITQSEASPKSRANEVRLEKDAQVTRQK